MSAQSDDDFGTSGWCGRDFPVARIAFGVAAAAVVALSAVVATQASTKARSGSGGACGFERWTVKTLQDRPRLLRNRLTTVHYLDTRPAPASIPDTRLPFERHIFTVIARVTFVREEADSDYHLGLTEHGSQMIGETPAHWCTRHATARRREQMQQARRAAKSCARARVTGVAFFDFDHGQTGVAPNAIELHPLLAFHCLTH